MNEKDATPAETHGEPIITPAHLAEMLPLYRAIVSHEGDTGTAPPLQASYMVALVEYASGQTERADALQSELDEIARYESMKLNHNGGDADGSY